MDSKPISIYPNAKYLVPHKPCKSCPFRETSCPGWFGPYNAEYYRNAAHGEGWVQCHETSALPEDKHRHCTGIVLYREKSLKSPRYEEARAHQDACVKKYGVKGILDHRTFMQHHESAHEMWRDDT